MADQYSVLKEYFGHTSFRPGQEDVIRHLLCGRDCLCIMPTGGGKSLCYQVPALLFPGVTLVISPLISLMKDQVNALLQSGISAAYINRSLTPAEYHHVLGEMRDGKYKIVYVAPERLTVSAFLDVCHHLSISLVAVDEAHCVSQWGQDFRPSYLKIAAFIGALSNRPVIGAFTATATEAVKKDIEKILCLQSPFSVTTGFDRPNLYFSVLRQKDKDKALLSLLAGRPGRCGIVYCATRKTVEEVCNFLRINGYPATRYHAGLSDEERRHNQDDFIYDRRPLMVATNAFGMGIDKSNVSFVIHYHMPKNMESYYQEAGRAGRDGSAADCILLYSAGDVRTNRYLIDHTEPNPDLTEEEQAIHQKLEYERLKDMVRYCGSHDCLRRFMLNYFGENAPSSCGYCSNCRTKYEALDITIEAQKILSCIIRTGGHYGKKMIADILRGSRNERLLRLGLDTQTTYGLMRDTAEERLLAIIDFLCERGYIRITDGEYPVLEATVNCRALLRGEEKISMKVEKTQRAEKEKDHPSEVDTTLFAELKKLRRKLAERADVPAYVIFSDATLLAMCQRRPKTLAAMLDVPGVGQAKLDRYGKAFLALIASVEEEA